MMASSMVTSERRWASTRKSGMTVLGKVPKPINLPSQKLENHGLDPNVEIVPKGTLTWGSRPLASSNAWGSSILSSPKADGSVSSPIYGNGRPSSGGSGGRPSSGGSSARPSSGGSSARPSSGGSERSNEPTAIQWGPSSRPSSASGILPTCHTSVAANRPRSAETRPNSSQLSRFAERSGDSITCGATRTSEELSNEASKNSDFTLSSGDFPTLGSEKNFEMKSQPGHTSKGPASAPGLYSTFSQSSDSQLASVHENFNRWNLDTHPDAGKDASTRMENQHMDHDNLQPQLIENVIPQQFVSLPDGHIHPPNGVWFGGHKAVGPYRPLGPPGSYNMDPYYPYIPAGAIPNAQAFPRIEAIPKGVQLKDGESYRHMPPESYIAHNQSTIPLRPGVYPSPFLYEGPYGTPRASFDNSKQVFYTVGMKGQYDVHNQHPSENTILEPWKFHAQTDGCTPGMMKEQKICGQGNETQGQSKVLLKRHDSHEVKDTPAKNQNITAWPTTKIDKKPGFSTQGDLLASGYKQEQTSSSQQFAEVFVSGKSGTFERGGNSQSHNQKRVRNIKATIDHHEKLKSDSYGNDEMKCTPKTESLVNISVEASKSEYELSIPISPSSQEAPEGQGTHHMSKSSWKPSSLESVDHDVQRANAKEMARQRAIQLQKKEEERTREQKAKALAKLDELNRRTLAVSKQTLCHAQNVCNEGLNNKPDTASAKDLTGSVAIEASCGSLFQDFEVQRQGDDNIKRKCDPGDLSFNLPPSSSESSFKVSGTQQEQSSSLNQDATLEIIAGRAATHLPDSTVSKRKQLNYRRKNMTDDIFQSQKANSENTVNMKCVSMVSEDASNGLGVLSCEDPPTVQSRKKNSRNPKYKNNLNDTQPSHSLPSSEHLEGISGRSDGESDETKAPARVVEPAAVFEKSSNETMEDKGSIDLIYVPNQAGAEPARVTSTKANNNWKPRPHKKAARNLQIDKANIKCQESETVVWAPVKVVNKNRPSEEFQKSSASDANDLLDEKNEVDMHNGAKARRAEIERYVPKPVSKELSKQGGFPQTSSPLLSQASSSDFIGKLDLAPLTAVTSRASNSVVVRTSLAFNYRNTEETKQNRHGKAHTSWRQRNSSESQSLEQGSLEGSLSFEPPKYVEKASELQPSMPSDDDWHMEGGNGLQDQPTQLLGVAKNHGISRQRRQQFKTQRVDRSNYAAHNKILQGGVHDKTEIQSPILAGSGERNSSKAENQNTGSDHMRSQWQPKSQVHPRADKLLPSQTEKNHDGSDVGQRNNMIEANDMSRKEGNIERKFITNHTKNQEVTTGERKDMIQPSKSKIQSHREQELAIPVDSAPVSADNNHVQHDLHRHAHYRGRFHRERVVADGGSKRILSSGGLRNDDQHFEYQKAASYYKPGDSFQQNPSATEETPGAHRVSSSGTRYGEQGRNPARRGGHFSGPQCGAPVRVSSAYNDREW